MLNFVVLSSIFFKLWIITKKDDKSIGYEISVGVSVTLWKILILAFYHSELYRVMRTTDTPTLTHLNSFIKKKKHFSMFYH
jgi:hypothetical protein